MGTPVSGQVPAPTPDPSAPSDATPAPSFDVCKSNAPVGRPQHGRLVSEALLEVAPDVDLYVSNANNVGLVFDAVNWLTASGVKVINISAGAVWDGPGDGTSPFDDEMRRSYLNIVNDAVAGGAVWVSSSGNNAPGTWFHREPDFTDEGYLDFDRSELGTSDCNEVGVFAGMGSIFQLRWSGPWGGSDIELVLHLVRLGHGARMTRLWLSRLIPSWVKTTIILMRR